MFTRFLPRCASFPLLASCARLLRHGGLPWRAPLGCGFFVVSRHRFPSFVSLFLRVTRQFAMPTRQRRRAPLGSTHQSSPQTKVAGGRTEGTQAEERRAIGGEGSVRRRLLCAGSLGGCFGPSLPCSPRAEPILPSSLSPLPRVPLLSSPTLISASPPCRPPHLQRCPPSTAPLDPSCA